jgi:hypothetical protein
MASLSEDDRRASESPTRNPSHACLPLLALRANEVDRPVRVRAEGTLLQDSGNAVLFSYPEHVLRAAEVNLQVTLSPMSRPNGGEERHLEVHHPTSRPSKACAIDS